MFYDTIQCPLQLVELGRSFFSSYVFPSPSFIFLSAPIPSCDINDAGCYLKALSSLSQQLCKETKAVPAVSWLSNSEEIQPFPSFSLSTFARLAKTQGTKAGHEITNQNNRQDIRWRRLRNHRNQQKKTITRIVAYQISDLFIILGISLVITRNHSAHLTGDMMTWIHANDITEFTDKSLNQEYSRFSVHIW